MQTKVLSGPHVKCVVNGRTLGIVTSFQYSIRTPHRPAQGLDQTTVQEWIPTTYLVMGQVGIVRVRGDGGLEGAGLAAFSADLLRQKYLQIDLVDRLTERVLFSAINAVVTGQAWQVEARDVVRGQFTFEAQDQSNNEAAP